MQPSRLEMGYGQRSDASSPTVTGLHLPLMLILRSFFPQRLDANSMLQEESKFEGTA